MNQNDQMREALQRAFNLGQRYWQQVDSDYQSEHKKADETYQKYKQLVEDTTQALNHTPDTGKMADHIGDANKMVRLDREDLSKLWQKSTIEYLDEFELIANAIMDAMVKKNGG